MIRSRTTLAQIDAAVAAGATLIAGGEPRDGNFVAPTILADVTHAMDVMREETFGPVACVQAFRTVDEALRLANDTPFGLGAAVFGISGPRSAHPPTVGAEAQCARFRPGGPAGLLGPCVVRHAWPIFDYAAK